VSATDHRIVAARIGVFHRVGGNNSVITRKAPMCATVGTPG
jgi:hypothetical protein